MLICVLCNGLAKRVYDDGYCPSCMTDIIEANLELDRKFTGICDTCNRGQLPETMSMCNECANVEEASNA
jgi:hypothetical protein